MTNNVLHYLIPKEPRVWQSMLLAVLVHVFLFLFLWIDISWQNDTPKIIQAELWSLRSQEASHNLSLRLIETPTPEMAAAQPDKVIAAVDNSWGSESKKQVARIESKQERKIEIQQPDDSKDLPAAPITITTKEETADTQAIDDLEAWQKRISRIVRSNIQFDVPNHGDTFSTAEFEITVRTDGSIDGEPQLIKSSSIPGFDETVRRAIVASAPFPPNNLVRSLSLTLSYRPNDFKP